MLNCTVKETNHHFPLFFSLNLSLLFLSPHPFLPQQGQSMSSFTEYKGLLRYNRLPFPFIKVLQDTGRYQLDLAHISLREKQLSLSHREKGRDRGRERERVIACTTNLICDQKQHWPLDLFNTDSSNLVTDPGSDSQIM